MYFSPKKGRRRPTKRYLHARNSLPSFHTFSFLFALLLAAFKNCKFKIRKGFPALLPAQKRQYSHPPQHTRSWELGGRHPCLSYSHYDLDARSYTHMPECACLAARELERDDVGNCDRIYFFNCRNLLYWAEKTALRYLFPIDQ